MKKLDQYFEANFFDVIVSNPPYFKSNTKVPLDESKRLARNEQTLNIRDIFIIAKKLLKDGGNIAIVIDAERLVEVIELMKENSIEPKRIQFVYPKNTDKLILLLEKLKEENIKYKVLGFGSNVIFSDDIYDGVIIKLDEFNDIKMINDTTIKVGAGYNLIKLALFATKKSLSGLEFACGIPGSVGGAVYMNAGAYNHFFSDIIEFVYYLDEKYDFKVIRKEDRNFSFLKETVNKRLKQNLFRPLGL